MCMSVHAYVNMSLCVAYHQYKHAQIDISALNIKITKSFAIMTAAHISGPAVDEEDDADGEEVDDSEDVLGHPDVGSMLCGVVQPHEHVHKPCWVPDQQ